MTTTTKPNVRSWEPTIEQLRREYDRRGLSGRRRKWPKCKGSLRHRIQAWRATRLSDGEIKRRLNRAQVRFDPPMWSRDCTCGVRGSNGTS